jgi:hypothetical protein
MANKKNKHMKNKPKSTSFGPVIIVSVRKIIGDE